MSKIYDLSKNPSLEDLMQRLIEAEETIEAIKYNKVDALLISTKNGEQVWTLKDTERPYRMIIEQMNEGALTISGEGAIAFSNNKFAELLHVPFEYIIGSSIFKWIGITDLNRFTEFLQVHDENSSIEINLLNADGNPVPVSVCLNTIPSEDGQPVICLTITDLTEQKKNEEIFAAEKLARSVIEQAVDAIIVCDESTKIIRASRGAEKLAGEPLLNKSFDSVFTFEDEMKNRILIGGVLTDVLPVQLEVLYERKDGEAFNLICKASQLSGGAHDKVQGYIITLTNITTHVKEEERITASLKEKTILLKEIHHRVKNNLQMVSSLLNIQSAYIKEQSLKDIFSECQLRISSMALIHQKLYESKSLSKINIIDYIKDLAMHLCSTYIFNSKNLTLHYGIKEVYFPIESAIPLGLIVNELVTNCLKHAFKNIEDPHITIHLSLENNGSFSISVKDNGVGFPDDFDITKTETLGLDLVQNLAYQLNGTVKLNRSNGAEFIVIVPAA